MVNATDRRQHPTAYQPGEGGTHDCGYPSSVQGEDGTIVTVYYASDVISEQYNRRRMGFYGAAILYRPEDLP